MLVGSDQIIANTNTLSLLDSLSKEIITALKYKVLVTQINRCSPEKHLQLLREKDATFAPFKCSEGSLSPEGTGERGGGPAHYR